MASQRECPYCYVKVSELVYEMHISACKSRPPETAAVAIAQAPPPMAMAPAPIVPSGAVKSPDVEAMAAQIAAPVQVAPMATPPPIQVSAPTGNGLYMPTRNPVFMIPTDLGQMLDRIEIMSAKKVQRIGLVGPQGAGKTSLAEQYAAKYKRPLYIVPCVTMQEASQWWGSMQVSVERGTYYVPSAFCKAVETPRAVICLDDMNRVENPKVLNPLFPLLDYRGQTHLDELGRTVKVADGVVFFATINEGFAFQGTDPIDLALRDRFRWVKMRYPEDDTLERILRQRTGINDSNARILGKFASALATHRTHPVPISVRQLIDIADDVAAGAVIRDAVKFTMTASLSKEELEGVLQTLQTLLSDNYQSTEPKWENWGA